MGKCIVCGKALTKNDRGLTKKLINRGAEEFLCIECLSKKFNVPVKRLEEKIQEFKEQGCLLF